MRLALKGLLWALPAVMQLGSSTVAAQGTAGPEVVAPGSIGRDGAYRVGNGVAPPTVLTRVGPGIPVIAQTLRASGDVFLSVVVQADGTLRDIQVVKPAGYGMDERAVETVKKWRFRAGTKDGTPVDVRIQAAVGFRIAPEANTWGAGPLVFDSASAITRPVLKSGTMPKAVRQAGNEIVLLQFTVGPSGEVGDIHALQGSESTSLPVLTSSLLKWRFAPASNGAVSLPAVGKVLLIKGEDQFRYQVSSAFRDSGAVRLPARESDQVSPSPANADPGPITVVVPVKLRLEPDEAKKQLVYQVPAQYPTDAKLAGIQGTVVLGITIGTDGEVKDLREISGPPQLIPAAVAAVKQWRYRPALYGGRPWEASTEVEIQFKLPE